MHMLYIHHNYEYNVQCEYALKRVYFFLKITLI